MLPAALAYVYAGTARAEAVVSEKGRVKTTPETIIFWGGLLATVVVLFWVTKIARNNLNKYRADISDTNK